LRRSVQRSFVVISGGHIPAIVTQQRQGRPFRKCRRKRVVTESGRYRIQRQLRSDPWSRNGGCPSDPGPAAGIHDRL